MKTIFYTPEIDKEKFSQNLRKLIKEKNIDINALMKTGMENDYEYHAIYKFVKGKGMPSLEVLFNIAHIFGESVDDLLFPIPAFTICDVDNIAFTEDDIFLRTVHLKDGDYLQAFPTTKEFLLTQILGIENVSIDNYIESYITTFNKFPNHIYSDGIYKSKKHINEKTSPLKCKIDNEKTYKNIDYLIKQAGLSDEVIASILNYKSIKSIKRWHSGDQQTLPLDKLYKLSWVFNHPLEEMVECNYYITDDSPEAHMNYWYKMGELDRTEIKDKWYSSPQDFSLSQDGTKLRIKFTDKNFVWLSFPDEIYFEMEQKLEENKNSCTIELNLKTAEEYYCINFSKELNK